MLALDKHSSLLGTVVNYGCKKFYNTWPRIEMLIGSLILSKKQKQFLIIEVSVLENNIIKVNLPAKNFLQL
jgi:hypothetical protein